MAKLSLFTPLVALALAAGTHAAIGPVADLIISDQTVSPDGFARSAVVANGGTPGPLIRGNKVSDETTQRRRERCSVADDVHLRRATGSRSTSSTN